jgi:nucleotide-binding universal stress UspA family protein
MMRAKNIVLATDFSESSEAALQVATALARDCRATLHLLHVKEPFSAYNLSGRYGDVPAYPDLDALRSALERVVPSDTTVPVRRWLCTSAEVAPEILKLADEVAADLIVMGTHGRAGLSRLLTGSVAESVIRQARCPVLTVKSPPSESEGAA